MFQRVPAGSEIAGPPSTPMGGLHPGPNGRVSYYTSSPGPGPWGESMQGRKESLPVYKKMGWPLHKPLCSSAPAAPRPSHRAGPIWGRWRPGQRHGHRVAGVWSLERTIYWCLGWGQDCEEQQLRPGSEGEEACSASPCLPQSQGDLLCRPGAVQPSGAAGHRAGEGDEWDTRKTQGWHPAPCASPQSGLGSCPNTMLVPGSTGHSPHSPLGQVEALPQWGDKAAHG